MLSQKWSDSQSESHSISAQARPPLLIEIECTLNVWIQKNNCKKVIRNSSFIARPCNYAKIYSQRLKQKNRKKKNNYDWILVFFLKKILNQAHIIFFFVSGMNNRIQKYSKANRMNKICFEKTSRNTPGMCEWNAK